MIQIPSLIDRQSAVVTTFLILVLSVVYGCSSDGDDEPVQIPATVPDLLNYEIRQSTGVALNLTQASADATVTSALLTGTFNRITEAFTLNVQPAAMVVSAADFLSALDTALGGGNINFSDYSLHVTGAAIWVGDGNPISGEFDIFDDAVRKITVSVNPDVNNGMPGVDITYWPNGEGNPGSSVTSLTWVELDAVFDEPGAEAYARIAAFAYSMLRFMYEQGELVILALEFLGDNDALLESTGSVEESCDTFPLAPSSPVLDPGMSTVSWYDASFNNDLGPGDTFYLDFIECWDDDETDSFDTLYDGTVNFVNYTEVESGGVVTRIGFEPTAGPGGIDYDYLEITETETTLSEVLLEFNETITLNGGFSMVFTSP